MSPPRQASRCSYSWIDTLTRARRPDCGRGLNLRQPGLHAIQPRFRHGGGGQVKDALGSTIQQRIGHTHYHEDIDERFRVRNEQREPSGRIGSGQHPPVQRDVLSPCQCIDRRNHSFFSTYASDSVLFLNLSGTGTAGAALTATPPVSASAASRWAGVRRLSQTVTNTGALPLTISVATVTGSGFTTSGLGLPLLLAAGQSFTFKVIYAPTSTGSASGTLSLVFGSSNAGLGVPLSGTGTTPAC